MYGGIDRQLLVTESVIEFIGNRRIGCAGTEET